MVKSKRKRSPLPILSSGEESDVELSGPTKKRVKKQGNVSFVFLIILFKNCLGEYWSGRNSLLQATN